MNTGHLPGVVSLDFYLGDEHYYGEANPLKSPSPNNIFSFDVTLNAEHLGIIFKNESGKWILNTISNQELVNRIGEICETRQNKTSQ